MKKNNMDNNGYLNLFKSEELAYYPSKVISSLRRRDFRGMPPALRAEVERRLNSAKRRARHRKVATPITERSVLDRESALKSGLIKRKKR